MSDLEFAGPALPLADADIIAAAQQLGVEPAVIHAVDEVESRGAGFLPDGRPKILFERHVFSRLTEHQFDASHPDISNPTPGGYGAAGAHQHDRLAEAIALDRESALESASWGRFQIMGFNAEICGWPDVESFVASMTESEAQHLKAFIGFCEKNNLVRYLAAHQWESFTNGYNGSGNVADYSQKLVAAYEKHAAAAVSVHTSDPAGPQVGGMPNAISPIDKIKAVQLVLGVTQDGAFGRRSRAAFNDVLRAANQPGI